MIVVLDAARSTRPAPARAIGHAATAALHDELALEPKPGLVSFANSGSHVDMDAGTFMRSLFALRHYFPQAAAAGAANAPFPVLEALGIAAERRMLRATGGINTHRGAIFLLGLLCAGLGRVAGGGAPTPCQVREAISEAWGDALRARRARGGDSNGQRAARRHGLRSAGDEAAAGFPVLFDTALPALRQPGLDGRAARLQALFHTMAELDDTNVAHRGGIEGLRHVQRAARAFLDAGGAGRPDGVAHARAIHEAFVARRLSPGGAADVLAAACLLDRTCERP
nr:ATP:dephospho-CoA triphosphoribosyl transferase [uncultured organism]